MEKAWAKVFKGYGNIAEGLIGEALRDLTGASVQNYLTNKESQDRNWFIISQAIKDKFILTAGSVRSIELIDDSVWASANEKSYYQNSSVIYY